MTAPHLRAIALACAALAVTAVATHAQAVTLDEGTFRLSVGGTAVGTESFVIRRSGEGAGVTTVAQGRIVLDTGDQTRSLLQFEGPGLRPTAYQIEVTGSEKQSISGQAAGSRFRATVVSTSGEQMREYLASEGAVVLDDGVAHQHYFLISATNGDGSVPIIIPRQSRQVSARVSELGSEQINIGGQAVQARRYRVEPQGLAARTVWTDAQNRILRLRIPDEEYLAERTSLP